MVSKTQFISLDEKTKAIVEEKFQYKREFAKAKEQALFGIFDEDLTHDEELALKYIFAYMPLNDLADYEGPLFLAHVRKALDIQKRVPWGERIPASVFLHFVLPYRVNNENIEDSRGLLFDEIYPRVKDLSMEEAILETNHWCHEKANYVGNDPRTVSPLTLMRTALGRCGEQSTLAVAALRSIGIPARQVYTPLWAHSDSNHAWVEAWADGEWHFFGACEPEPKLNQGWFQNPAKRGMLIHTRINAEYNGLEEVTIAHPWYSELNLTNLYAKTKAFKVHVTDQDGNPAQAKVQFQLFNFGGFRPMLSKETDASGTVEVSFGLGDVYISVVGEAGWGFAKASVHEMDEITIALTTDIHAEGEESFKMIPPPDRSADETIPVTEAEKELHGKRVQEGAGIRTNYEATFLQEADAEEIARECGLPADRVWEVLKPARGNSHEIAAFLKTYAKEYGEWSLKLLEVLNPKDLTDTFRPTLLDHLQEAMAVKEDIQGIEDDFFASYILCPRVEAEMITPYRSYFVEAFKAEDVKAYRANPAALVEAVDAHVKVVRDMTYYRGAATPEGSFKLRKADPLSRDILFVALARSLGIPARLEPSDRRPQFYADGRWHNAQFQDQETVVEAVEQTGTVVWKKEDETEEIQNYFKHLSIARFTNGTYQALFYKFSESTEPELELPVGHYRIITNKRLPDGTSLLCLRYFEVKADEEVSVLLKLPVDSSEVAVIAEANLDCTLETMAGEYTEAIEQVGEAGTTFMWIEPDREPSKHVLRELREMKAEWETLNVRINCFVSEEKWDLVHALHIAGDLPKNLVFFREKASYDALNSIGQNVPTATEGEREFPVVYVLDEKQEIRHMTEGYKLGISREVVDVYKQIEQLKSH